MGSMNKVLLLGNVGKDPVIHTGQTGNVVAKFSLATSESWKDKNTGQKTERTEWHNVAVFGKLADIVSSYVHKGDTILIEGKLKTSKYTKEGIDRYSTDIVANNVTFVKTGKKEVEQSQQNNNDIPDDGVPF